MHTTTNKFGLGWMQILFAVLLLGAAPYASAHRGTIVGQVVDGDGVPVAGVAVTTQRLPSVTTNAGGMYTLVGVKQKRRVVVSFSKPGYANTQGIVGFYPTKIGNAARVDNDDDEGDDDDDDKSHGARKLKQVALFKTILKSGDAATVNAATGGSVTEGGFKVTFAPNSFTVAGDIDVAITPIDVSTAQVIGAPGDFWARTRAGRRVLLESFGMADFTLTQNGVPVNLRAGTTADIELLLPASTSLVAGDVKSMWFYDTASGLWQEENAGTVAASTTTPGRLAVFATVSHFSWWNCDQPLLTTCAQGLVLNSSGAPLVGAYITATGVTYGGSAGASTDATGRYCIPVRVSGTSAITASIVLPGGLVTGSSSTSVTTSSTIARCATGGCAAVPTLTVVDRSSCISGDVLDAAGVPVAGVTVFSSTGGTAVSSATGTFQFAAPENYTVTLYAVGYKTITVTSSPSGTACAAAAIRPIVVGGGTACISGAVYQCAPWNPLADVVVTAVDSAGNHAAVSNPSTAAGKYCIDNVAANSVFTLMTSSVVGQTNVTTGAAGATCAADNCAAAPGMDLFCY